MLCKGSDASRRSKEGVKREETFKLSRKMTNSGKVGPQNLTDKVLTKKHDRELSSKQKRPSIREAQNRFSSKTRNALAGKENKKEFKPILSPRANQPQIGPLSTQVAGTRQKLNYGFK